MPNKKYAVLTDSACDMPFDMEKECGVHIMNFGITVDGTPYTEREDFDFDEYYHMLRICEGVPSTAHMAADEFKAIHPGSGMEITIVDSHAYSMAYGWFVMQAIHMLDDGQPMHDVAAYLRDIFTRVEISLAAFSLRFMKKSGRISAAAAFAGELLGKQRRQPGLA